MNKAKKIILITVLSILGIILLDSIQALIFNNNPLIKIREYYNGGTLNYKDIGLLVDTYCGTNGVKDTVIKGFSYSLSDDKYTDDSYYKEIAEYVIENEEKLEGIAKKYINKETTEFPNKIDSVNVFEGNNTTIVEFCVNSLRKQYSGFYYSVDNIPVAYQNAPMELVHIEENVWEWDAVGDNFGRTIKITDYWFYYEARF